MIDLRSDTVTLPGPEMRRVMSEAAVGDDVYGEDPTVNHLEEMSASLMGKEKAVFVPSGTMGNQLAILGHCRPGTEVIMEADSHIYYYEAAAASVFAGIQPRPLAGRGGIFSAEMMEEAVRDEDIHQPPTSLVCLENTHNRAGGRVIPLDKMDEIYAAACRHKLPLHLDGARIFNAAVAMGVAAKEIAARTTSVQFCLSKGLGAPVGSILAGDAPFINEARRWRKRLGGGMRQAGIIAAAGVLALEKMVDRLAEDHDHARRLAEGLATLPGLNVKADLVETNIVLFTPTLMPASILAQRLREKGLLVGVMAPGRIRLVTNKDVDSAAIERALTIIASVVGENSPGGGS